MKKQYTLCFENAKTGELEITSKKVDGSVKSDWDYIYFMNRKEKVVKLNKVFYIGAKVKGDKYIAVTR